MADLPLIVFYARIISCPSFGFLLATTQPDAACRVFADRGLAAAACGTFDATNALRLAAGGETRVVWDLAARPLTGLAGSPSAGA